MKNTLLWYTVMLSMLIVFGTVRAHAEGTINTPLEQLQAKVAQQAQLVTKLRAEFHRLKYEVIPHAYSKSIVDVEKIVGAIGANTATIEHELLPELETQGTSQGNVSVDSMTAAQLAEWVETIEGGAEGRTKAIIEMLPFVTDLNPLTLRMLAYKTTVNMFFDYRVKEVLDAGTKILNERNQ